MKLAEARRLALKLRKAEQEFDASWEARWRAIVRSSVLLTLPLSAALGSLAHLMWPDPAGLIVFFAAWAMFVVALALTGPTLRRRAKRRQGMETTDARVLQACENLEGVAPEVAAALERGLDAYLQISRSADDPVWTRSGVPMTESVRRAGEHLLALFDWGRRLSDVRGTVVRLADRPEGAEVKRQYDEHLSRLLEAAAAFETVEAKSARAYVALAGAAPGQAVSAADLAGLGAGFDALAEVLGSRVAAGPAEQQQLSELPIIQVGRTG